MVLKNNLICFVFVASGVMYQSLQAEGASLPPLRGGAAPQTVQELWAGYDPRGRKLSLRLRADSRFLSEGLNLGSFSLSRSIERKGPRDVMIDRHDFKSKDDKELEWSRITRFYLSIVDEASKARIDLTSKEGRGMLKSITLN
ncbi:MAG: hypothetical protein ACYSWZ_04415 [Planctomycetota bacterium]|jgi:hypothetical protein